MVDFFKGTVHPKKKKTVNFLSMQTYEVTPLINCEDVLEKTPVDFHWHGNLSVNW